ncbi:MAG: pyridoxal-phosphate dependent enzyme, partial [Actinomycetota bacterium]
MTQTAINPNLKRPRSTLELVGNTPLLDFPSLGRELPPGVRVFAKAEWCNPGGSVKDRAALNMVMEAERSGELTPDKIILDATSGNTGIALA